MLLLYLTAGAQIIIPKIETSGATIGGPKSSVLAILPDRENLMWFGPGNILKRYGRAKTYTLLVGAAGPNAHQPKGQPQITTVSPFWKTLPLIGMVLSLLILAGTVINNNITQKRLKRQLVIYERQLKLDKERQRVSREMHDNIGAGLAQISLISASINPSNLKQKEEIIEIADANRKLVSSMSEIIWSMHPAGNLLDEFFVSLRESLHALLGHSGIPYHIFLPESIDQIILTAPQRRDIPLIVKEVVNNAIKYSQAKEIIVKAVMIRDGVQFFISDNGIGFDMNKQVAGKGIDHIQKRICDLDGRITITAEAGAGTHITFFIPLQS